MLILFPCSFNSDESVNKDFQRVLDKALSKYNAKGVSASIVYPDWGEWNGVIGISYDTVSIEPDMLYAIGSITKNFVASLTFKLTEECILALDDPISNWDLAKNRQHPDPGRQLIITTVPS